MFRITIRYGIDQAERDYAMQPTVGQIRSDRTLRASLGYGDNVNLLVNGVPMPDDARLPNGATITVETAANQKAA